MFQISQKYDFEIKTMETDIDHIHFLISSTPQISVSQIIRVLKQESTIGIWKKYFSFLKKCFWKEHTFWSDGYFCSTIGNVSEKTLQKYIEKQGKD